MCHRHVVFGAVRPILIRAVVRTFSETLFIVLGRSNPHGLRTLWLRADWRPTYSPSIWPAAGSPDLRYDIRVLEAPFAHFGRIASQICFGCVDSEKYIGSMWMSSPRHLIRLPHIFQLSSTFPSTPRSLVANLRSGQLRYAAPQSRQSARLMLVQECWRYLRWNRRIFKFRRGNRLRNQFRKCWSNTGAQPGLTKARPCRWSFPTP